jgi:N-acyl-D-amino-acid deacylase
MNGAQLDRAINLLKEELEAGAGGLSFGLEYMPGSSHEEVIAMSRVAARYDKLISIHIRSDRYQGLEALEEAFDISRICGAKVQISHVVYQFGFGMMHQAMDMINRAIDEGVDISCDSGMYTSFSTNIGTAVFDEGCVEKWHCSYDSLITPCGKYAGQKLSRESYEDLRKNFPDEVAIALVGNPDEIPLAFDLPSMMASSDAGVNASDKKVASHPQDTSAFPRFIRQMVVEQGRLTLLDAVSRITSIPAKRMGLAQKGILAEGNDADITIFDLKTMRDNAVFPHLGAIDALPDGIQAVLVNGTVAIENKKIINDKAGKILYFPNRNWQY